MSPKRIDEHTLKVLEFDALRELAASFAASGLGKEAARTLYPSWDAEWIAKRLGETTEIKQLLENEIRIPLAGIRDIRHSLTHIGEKQSVLEPRELLDIRDTVSCCGRLKDFFAFLDDQKHPHLHQMGENLSRFDTLIELINECIESDENVRDDASPALKEIRQKIGQLGAAIQQKFREIISTPEMRNAVENDKFLTRNGRAVIALKANYRQYLKGIILDRSNSGATLYVEPYGLAELSNELEDAISQEKKEVWQILWKLTKAVLDQRDLILKNVKKLTQIDLTYAKARFSVEYQMSPPQIHPGTFLQLTQARHPLLLLWAAKPKDSSITQALSDVVPIDVRLGQDFDLLLMTGPNTGGKTVALKTIGLLTLMAQCGMHIPASADSRIPIYRQVFADIGDEQSIQQSLSTFSSHVQQLVRILNGANQYSLVLLDELGTGTAPSEAGVLGMAVLDQLRTNGSKVVATSHLDQLKTYAYSTPRVENASVQFDLETLQPTFHLVIGTPGSSNALDIAKRLGMAANVIRHARALLNKKKDRTSDLINQVQATRAHAEEKRKHAQALLKAAQGMYILTDQRLQRSETERTKLMDQANAEIEKSLRKVREILNEYHTEAQNAPKPWNEHSEKLLQQIAEVAAATTLAQRQTQFAETVQTGDTVYSLSFDRTGTILKTRRKKQTFTLLIENKQVEVPATDIYPPKK
jgi:DNA mismatch repair protein MutS2